MNSIKTIFANLMLLIALTTIFAFNATANQTTEDLCGVFCVLLEDQKLLNDDGNSHHIAVEGLISALANGADKATLAAVDQHLDAIGQNATATALNATDMNDAAIQSGLESLMILTAELVGLATVYSNNAADLAAAYASGDYTLMGQLVDDGQMLIAAMQTKGNDIRKEIQVVRK